MHGVISRYTVKAVWKWFGCNVSYKLKFNVNDTEIYYIYRHKLIKTDEKQGLFL